jgi:hypothetical protein
MASISPASAAAATTTSAAADAYVEAYLSFNNLAFPIQTSSLLGSKAILAKAGMTCHPVSFVLPEDASKFLATFQEKTATASEAGTTTTNRQRAGGSSLWLYKPAKQTGGMGIVIFDDEGTARRLVKKAKDQDVMQQYIPSILVDDCKVDIRVYVLITQRKQRKQQHHHHQQQPFGPCMHVYLYQKGFVRSCVHTYDGTSTDLSCHLTNVSFAKRNNVQPKMYELDDDKIRNWLDWGNIKDSILQSISGIVQQHQEMMIPTTSCVCYLCQRGCAQLFGYDILVDDTKRAWVLEANIHPKLRFDERNVDRSLFRDIIKILVGEEGWDNDSLGSFASHIGNKDLWFDGAFDGKPSFDRIL